MVFFALTQSFKNLRLFLLALKIVSNIITKNNKNTIKRKIMEV